MNEIKCEVIRDLSPLYEDNAASEGTQELVRAHLKDCPSCREELRKMRVPISLPPDEDEEAVKRFLEYQAELRRKQNVKIVCVVSVLAVFIVFILCYTLIPRSWDSVSRGAEANRLMGVYLSLGYWSDAPQAEAWQTDDEYEKDSAVIDAFMDALCTGSYRAELRNLMNYTPFASLFQNTSVHGLKGSIDLYLEKNNQMTANIRLYDTPDYKVHIYVNGNSNTFYYHADGQLYQAVAELMKKYGVQN